MACIQRRVDKEKALAMVKGGLTQTAVAEYYGVTRDAISKLIKRTEANKDIIDKYRENKAQIMEGIQVELLSAVSEAPIKEKQSLIVGAGILEDKIRLERGQSTVNTTVDIRMLIASIPTNSSPDVSD